MRAHHVGCLAIAGCFGLAGCGSSALKTGNSPDADAAGTPDAVVAIDAVAPRDAAPTSADSEPPRPDAGAMADGPGSSFVFTWGVQFTGSPQRVTCEEAGTPTVVINTFDSAGRTTTERFPCAAMAGATRALAPGSYELEAIIEDANGKNLGSSRRPIDLAPRTSTDVGELGFEVQSFVLSWSFVRGGRPITCADANGKTVELVARYGNEAPVTHSFACADGRGATKGVRQGMYALDVRLVGASGALLRQTSLPFDVPDDQRATLPPVVFDLGP
jgi:hypothetical protein